MRYLHVKNGAVVNVVDYPVTPPDESDTGENIVQDPTGTMNVGDAYDPTNDILERNYSRMDVVMLKELFRLTNESRALQVPPLTPLTTTQYKTRIKSLM